MMLASLSSFCQYPTVKTIGKDTIVIMTLKQGNEINNKFSSLNDSLISLNKKLNSTQETITVFQTQNKELNDNLSVSNKNLLNSDLEIKRLNQLLVDREKKFWNEKKTWAGWMFFSFVVTVLVAALK